MEDEVFKDIEGFEGLYQVSNLGNVKSLKFGKEKILKIHKGLYRLSKNNIMYWYNPKRCESKPDNTKKDSYRIFKKDSAKPDFLRYIEYLLST